MYNMQYGNRLCMVNVEVKVKIVYKLNELLQSAYRKMKSALLIYNRCSKYVMNYIDITLPICNNNIMKDSNIQLRDGLYGFEFRDIDHRRTPSDEPRKRYEIKQLWQRSHEIINLAARGFKHTDIAEILGITPTTVSSTLNSELGRVKLSDIRQEKDEEAKKISEKIRVLTNKAIATYHEIFDNENGEATLRDRKSVADTVLLELSGLRVPTKVQSQSISTVLTKEELENFKNRGKRAAEEIGVVIESTIHEGNAESMCEPSMCEPADESSNEPAESSTIKEEI